MGRVRRADSTARPQTLLLHKERGWTDEDFVHAVALYNLYHNYSEVSRQTGVPVATIRSWVLDTDRHKAILNYDQRLKETQDRLMQAMGFVAEEALQKVHEKLPEASAAQAATIYGILFDKQQMIAGNTGSTNFNLSMDLSGMDPEAAASLMRRVLDQKQSQVIETEGETVPD